MSIEIPDSTVGSSLNKSAVTPVETISTARLEEGSGLNKRCTKQIQDVGIEASGEVDVFLFVFVKRLLLLLFLLLLPLPPPPPSSACPDLTHRLREKQKSVFAAFSSSYLSNLSIYPAVYVASYLAIFLFNKDLLPKRLN